jgi:hypothetical protein
MCSSIIFSRGTACSRTPRLLFKAVDTTGLTLHASRVRRGLFDLSSVMLKSQMHIMSPNLNTAVLAGCAAPLANQAARQLRASHDAASRACTSDWGDTRTIDWYCR